MAERTRTHVSSPCAAPSCAARTVQSPQWRRRRLPPHSSTLRLLRPLSSPSSHTLSPHPPPSARRCSSPGPPTSPACSTCSWAARRSPPRAPRTLTAPRRQLWRRWSPSCSSRVGAPAPPGAPAAPAAPPLQAAACRRLPVGWLPRAGRQRAPTVADHSFPPPPTPTPTSTPHRRGPAADRHHHSVRGAARARGDHHDPLRPASPGAVRRHRVRLGGLVPGGRTSQPPASKQAS